MFETFGFDAITAKQVSVWFGLAVGVLFGLLGERTKFCFRRAVVAGEDQRSAQGVWFTALIAALLGTQVAIWSGLIAFDGHRFMAADLPVLAIVAGGLLFGAGMMLTRGCVSRLTVLTGTGNLRAALVLVVFAIVAHAALKGVLAPVRTTLGSVTVDLGSAVSLAALPGGALVWAGVIGLISLVIVLRSGARPATLIGAAALGLLVPAAWVGTGFVLLDEFDPIMMESLSFTSPAADSLFYTVASTAVPAGFGVGLLGGVVAGALVAALVFGSFRWQSFGSPAETGRYLTGAVLMGVGGVLAGGCTVGAGLAGIPTLSVAALLALVAIAAGGYATDRIIRSGFGSGAPSTTRALQPAE